MASWKTPATATPRSVSEATTRADSEDFPVPRAPTISAQRRGRGMLATDGGGGNGAIDAQDTAGSAAARDNLRPLAPRLTGSVRRAYRARGLVRR